MTEVPAVNVPRLTLRQWQIFVAVARHATTTAAADEIALSQSATSSAINELERLLSMALFDRTGKRLQLNGNGRALLPRAMAMLDGADAIEQMSRDGSNKAPSLRMGASTTIGNYVLPGLLADYFSPQRPGQASAGWSRVVIGNTAAICDAVAAFDLDLGLIEGSCTQAALTVAPWMEDEMLIVASPDGPPAGAARARKRITLRALREQVWLVREPDSGTREASDQGLLLHLRSYRRQIEFGSSEAMKHGAKAGLGVACLSSWVVSEALASGRLCRLNTTLPRQLRK